MRKFTLLDLSNNNINSVDLYESSNLGLNSKVKKKFNDVDEVGNVAYIKFEDPEVERICHEHGVYTVDDAARVSSIKGWFKDNETIKSYNELKFFTGLKTIEVQAFSYCETLQSVIIPDSVTSIGDRSFMFCKSLQSVIIPDSVTIIEGGAFSNCMALQSVIISDSVTSIEAYAFVWCTSLQSITIPDSVTYIGHSAFYECASLQSVIIPNSVTSIGSESFSLCRSLQSVTILDGVTSIEYGTFYKCKSLQYVTIPNSLTSIEESAFHGCSSLHSIYISKNCPVFDKIKKAYPEIHLIEPKVNESSSLGLNSKVKKKFNDVDAIDNITTLDLSQCYEYVKANISNAPITLEKAVSSFLDVSKSKYYIKVHFPNKCVYAGVALYIGYIDKCQGCVGIFISDSSMSDQLLKKFRKYLCNKNFKEAHNYPVFCSNEQENLPLVLLEYAVSLVKEETLEK